MAIKIDYNSLAAGINSVAGMNSVATRNKEGPDKERIGTIRSKHNLWGYMDIDLNTTVGGQTMYILALPGQILDNPNTKARSWKIHPLQ